MSEMIERVAVACVRHEMERMGIGRDTPLWNHAASEEAAALAVAQYGGFARAAIEAMREPTPRMCAVGDVSSVVDGVPESAHGIYQAMIDAALK